MTQLLIPLSNNLIYTSDDASIILNAKDAAAGNWRLKDWYLSTESFYTTDLIFYVLAIHLFGYSDKLLYLVPCFLYSVVILLASLLAGLGREKFRYQNAVITFILLTAFPRPAYDLLLRGPVHVGTIMYALICAILLYFEASRPKLFAVLFTAVLAFALVGDSFILYFFIIPLMAVQFLEFMNGGKLRPSFYAAIAAIAVAVCANQLLRSLGMNVQGLGAIKFVSWDSLQHNLFLFFSGVLQLFNALFPGEEVTLKTAVKFGANGLILIASVVAIFLSVRSSDRVVRIMAAACLLLSAEYILSNRPEDLLSTRYLLPAFVFSLVLAGKNIPSFLDNRRKQCLAAAVIVITILGFGQAYINSTNPAALMRNGDTAPALIAFLKEHNLSSGYGPYWSANIVTVKSQESVKVYTLKYDQQSKKLRPFLWLSKEEWYRQPANFLIIDNKKPWGEVTLENAVRSFGPPQVYYGGSRYSVLVWDKDISQDIVAAK